jgi:NADPH:quinone reductase-like Zn-dependent oxidoreductase
MTGLRWADPQPHERVAVLGIGGLGHLAVQYAKAAGFETIAVSHSPDKDQLIRDLGADEIVRDGKSLAAAGGADVIPQHFQFDQVHGGQHSGTAAGRPACHHGRGRGAAFDFSNGPYLEALSHHWQPAKRPRISLRSP